MSAYLPDLSWEAARERLGCPGAVGLWPIGATEAHGPHLPLWTDVYLSLELAFRVEAALQRPAVVLPPFTLTVTRYARAFPGTLSIEPELARGVLAGVLDGLAAHGLREVALLNSHLEPAHVALLAELAARPGVLFVDHCRKPWALELGEEFRSGDCHAGAYETSLMLASRFADRVDRTAAGALAPVTPGLVRQMRAGVPGFREMGADRAYFGDPAQASAAEGEALWGVLVRMWCERLGTGC